MSSNLNFNVNPSTFDQYVLTDIETFDVRFPMFLNNSGGDAVCKDPDFSSAYILLKFTNKYTNKIIIGHGLTFSLGRGNEIICHCMESMFEFVCGMSFGEIVSNPLIFSNKLSENGQMRWLGPEKGVIHLACCAYNNAIFDLWSWCYNKPLWKLICDMNTDKLVNLINFKYVSDVINPTYIKKQLNNNKLTIQKRINNLNKNGYPLYTMAVGWIGFDDDKVKRLCSEYLNDGFTAFKMKVGNNINDDKRRASLIRSCIGPASQCKLMMDVNQQWDINTAISWMKELSFSNPYWIEEPTSPDDIIGHKTIKNELNKFGIGVATGEVASNRVIFKQLLQTEAIDFAQPDAGRLNSVSEILCVLFMCKKFNIPAIFHAGAAGLNEMVRHYVMIDYLLISCTLKNRMCEYSKHLTNNFEEDAEQKLGKYYPPQKPGFVRLKMSSIKKYQFPNGEVWRNRLTSKL